MRPLTVSNAERKVLAAVNVPLAKVAVRTCAPNQHGGLKGRQLADAVLDIDAHGQMVARLAATDPAIILLDVASAFPSINWTS